jgi:glycosyltransferase involved in cell wall biosynthesis
MPSAPAISLVTPTRGRGALLRRSLQALQLQTLQDWEIIVVDDGDGSGLAVAASLGDARIRAVPNPGRGQVDARNAALELAQADAIQLLDDDDRWCDPQHLERVVDLLECEDVVVYRGGWLVLEDEVDGVFDERERRAFQPATTRESLRRDNTLLTSGVAYRRSLHDTLGGFDPDLGNYWDWDWFLRISAQRPLLEITPPAVLMSWRGSNTSRNPFDPARVAYLERLAAKHGLGTLESKNHATVLG